MARPGVALGGAPPGLYDDEPPFTDEERTGAGLEPIGEGTQHETYDEQTKRLKAQYREQERSRKAEIRSEAKRLGGSTSRGSSSGIGGFFKRGGTGSTVAAAGLGLVAAALGLNFLRGGSAQARGWLGAKFTNKAWFSTSTGPEKPSSPNTPSNQARTFHVPAGAGSPSTSVTQ